MPYEPMTRDPEAAKREHRERLYWLTLLGGAVNVIVIFMHLADINSALIGPLMGATCGSLIAAGIKGYTDSYYNALVAIGFRWLAIGLGVLLLLLWMHNETSLMSRLVPSFESFATDGYLIALILALLFHAGYAYAYLRDLIGTRGEA